MHLLLFFLESPQLSNASVPMPFFNFLNANAFSLDLPNLDNKVLKELYELKMTINVVVVFLHFLQNSGQNFVCVSIIIFAV